MRRRHERVCPALPLPPSPGMLLIVSLLSHERVSNVSCRISMGLLLPAGRATSWEAQRWSPGGSEAQHSPAQVWGFSSALGSYLRLTAAFYFSASLGFEQCFTFAYQDSLLPGLFLPVSVRAGWLSGPEHHECTMSALHPLSLIHI